MGPVTLSLVTPAKNEYTSLIISNILSIYIVYLQLPVPSWQLLPAPLNFFIRLDSCNLTAQHLLTLCKAHPNATAMAETSVTVTLYKGFKRTQELN